MPQFLKKRQVWLAKLAFWRKRGVVEAAPQLEAEAEPKPTPRAVVDDAETAAESPVAKPGVLARLKNLFTFRRPKVEAVADTEVEAREPKQRIRAADAPEAPEIPEPQPNFFARLKQSLSFRRKAVKAEVESDVEDVVKVLPKNKTRASEKSDEPAAPENPAPKPGVFARLKQSLRLRRKPAETEADADDKTLVIEKAKVNSDAAAPEGEAEVPPPSRLKRLLVQLRSKRVWVPALSLAVVGLVSWVGVFMMHTTQDKAWLQAELKTAKKMLEQKQVAAVKAPAPPPPSVPAEQVPAKPEPKNDPAFEIIGHVPAPKAEGASGISASDCVVKDKKSVSENLRSCISSFNEAVASTSQKPKMP